MSSYVKLHPQVKLQLISCNSQETVRMVSTNEADVGIIAGMCDQPEISSTLIDLEEFVLVATPEILRDHSRSKVLSSYPFISFQHGCNLDGFIGRCLEEIDYRPANVIECSSEETIKRAVLKHVGVAMLSAALIEKEIANGELTVLHRFSQRAETCMIYRKSRGQEDVIQAFSELAKDVWKTIRDIEE